MGDLRLVERPQSHTIGPLDSRNIRANIKVRGPMDAVGWKRREGGRRPGLSSAGDGHMVFGHQADDSAFLLSLSGPSMGWVGCP